MLRNFFESVENFYLNLFVWEFNILFLYWRLKTFINKLDQIFFLSFILFHYLLKILRFANVTSHLQHFLKLDVTFYLFSCFLSFLKRKSCLFRGWCFISFLFANFFCTMKFILFIDTNYFFNCVMQIIKFSNDLFQCGFTFIVLFLKS